MALLVDTAAAEAAAIAKRVEDAISSIIIRAELQLKVDIGVATAPADGGAGADL